MFDPFFLANTWVWQKTVMTMKSGVQNYVEIRYRIPKRTYRCNILGKKYPLYSKVGLEVDGHFHFFDHVFLADTWVWQKTVMTIGSGVKNYVEIRIRIVKSSSGDPKTAISHVFDVFLTEPGEGPKH